MMAGIISECRPGSNRNSGRDHLGIRRLEHFKAGFGEVVAARQLADLIEEPEVKLTHGRSFRVLADSGTLSLSLAIDGAPDIERAIAVLPGCKRDRINHDAGLVVGPSAGGVWPATC
tara:strand:+ start:12906 stop:13256 length:351 start_codon:yes stop_codon:yes gene_type:complete